MNIYEMYVANFKRAGFWVKRDAWLRTVARVVSVAGKVSGELPGVPPYHGNPEVVMDVYDVNGCLRERGAVLQCPGSYAYQWIKAPRWVVVEGGPQAGKR